MSHQHARARVDAPAAFIEGDNGVRLACYAQGNPDGPTLVFIHGYPDQHSVWDRLIAELGDTFRCISYDVRGAGASDRPAPVSAYALAHLRADLAAVLDWASPETPVHLIAHDWGSIQGWEAATDPVLGERIITFTSLSGPCLDHLGFRLRDQWANDRWSTLRQLRRSWYIGFFHLPLIPRLAWNSLLGLRFERSRDRIEGEALPRNPTLVADGVHGMKLYRANVLARLRNPRPRHARMPVLVVVADRDPFIGPDFVSGLDAWVDALEVARIDAAHWAIQTHAGEVAALVREFVANHDSSNRGSSRAGAARRVSDHRALA